MSVICSPLSGWLIKSNFSSFPFVFRWFVAWIALSDVDLHFSFIWVIKGNAIERRAASRTWIYQHNQSIHMNDGVTETLLLLACNTRWAATDHVCQIMLNWKLLCKFEKWCKFSSHIKTNLRRKNSLKERLAYMFRLELKNLFVSTVLFNFYYTNTGILHLAGLHILITLS